MLDWDGLTQRLEIEVRRLRTTDPIMAHANLDQMQREVLLEVANNRHINDRYRAISRLLIDAYTEEEENARARGLVRREGGTSPLLGTLPSDARLPFETPSGQQEGEEGRAGVEGRGELLDGYPGLTPEERREAREYASEILCQRFNDVLDQAEGEEVRISVARDY
jgi:hypothetical protein